MRYKTKDIGEEGLEVRVPVTDAWLAAEIPDVELTPAPQGLTLTGRLEPSGEDAYLLRGDLRGAARTACARCLEPAEVPFDQPVVVSYVEGDEAAADGGDEEREGEGGDDGGDVLTFSGGVIDLGGEIRDEILLALPISPLCRPDCAGICSVCGGNRNVKACDCEERQRMAGSKLSGLKDIKL